MILIIGGSYQGKTAYASEHFADGYLIYNHYHETIKEQMRSGLDPMEEARKLVASEEMRGSSGRQGKEIVIISDEIGYGLVPIDAFEREYREVDGRIHCYLAGYAAQVIRVTCGIGIRIK